MSLTKRSRHDAERDSGDAHGSNADWLCLNLIQLTQVYIGKASSSLVLEGGGGITGTLFVFSQIKASIE